MRMGIRAVLSVLLVAGGGFAQVPAGEPYNPEKHPNPILTFVERDDFKPTTYDEARVTADIELLGISADEGSRKDLDMASGAVNKIKILGRNTEVLFYPVVRQTFLLIEGESFILYSFKDPKPDIPSGIVASVLDRHAFTKAKKPEEGRFGLSSPPEQLGIRGSAALLFDDDGELTLFWQDQRASHVATSTVDRQTLFRLVEDLL